jgi:hypothetical protein
VLELASVGAYCWNITKVKNSGSKFITLRPCFLVDKDDDWVCPHRPSSTSLWQPILLLTFIQSGASLSRWLLHQCLPTAYIIAHHLATINSLVAGLSYRQSSTKSLRWSQHQPAVLPLCLPLLATVVIARRPAPTNALVASPFHHQLSTTVTVLRRSCHQPPPTFAAPVIGCLLRCCPQLALFITHCCVTINTLVAGAFAANC